MADTCTITPVDPAHPDAEVFKLAERLIALQAEVSIMFNTPGSSDQASEFDSYECWPVSEELEDTPAETGIKAKACAAWARHNIGPTEWGELIASIMFDLVGDPAIITNDWSIGRRVAETAAGDN